MSNMNEKNQSEQAAPNTKTKVGIAFQGGSFLAGAMCAGVVRGLVENGAFDKYDIQAFSGTSAGALVAAVCWEHTLDGKINDAPAILEKQWLRFASPMVPNQMVGDALKLIDKAWSHNQFYFNWVEKMRTPWMRKMFNKWISEYIHPDLSVPKLYELSCKKNLSFPKFVFGAAEILEGEIVGFTANDVIQVIDDAKSKMKNGGDLTENQQHTKAVKEGSKKMFQMIQASGSLDELNGLTKIDDDPFAGTYLDGAWGQNPPVSDLVECEVDEIWVVETAFPKKRKTIPRNFEEREDRHEELIQNAFVEHELEKIEKINEKLNLGLLINDKKRYLESLELIKNDKIRWAALKKTFEAKFQKSYKHDNLPIPKEPDAIIKKLSDEYSVKRLINTYFIRSPEIVGPMTAGARIVTSEPFLRDKMKLGKEKAKKFLDERDQLCFDSDKIL